MKERPARHGDIGGRAYVSHAGGRRFESSRAHHINHIPAGGKSVSYQRPRFDPVPPDVQRCAAFHLMAERAIRSPHGSTRADWKFVEPHNLLPPEGRERRMRCACSSLCMKECVCVANNADVLEVIKEHKRTELRFLTSFEWLRDHVQLPRGRPLDKNAVIGEHPPNESRAVVGSLPSGAPNIGAAKVGTQPFVES